MKKLVVGLCVLTALCILGLFALRCGGAEQGPIEVPPAAVPGGAGTWEAVQAAFALRGPSSHRDILREDRPPDLLLLTSWQQDAEALAALEAAMAGGALSLPVVEGVEVGRPDMAPFVQLSRASQLKGWELVAVDSEAAVDAVLEPARWGVLLKDADGDLISFIGGVSLIDSSLDQLDLMLDLLSGDQAAQRRALEALQALQARRAGPRAMAVECNGLDAYYGDVEAMTSGDGAWHQVRFLYDQDATVAWGREACRARIEQYEKPWGQRSPIVLESRWEDAGPLRYVHNPIGRFAIDRQVDYDRIIEGEDLVFAKRADLIAMLSARLGEPVQ